MDFSFIICTYNPPLHILEMVLRSCLAQKYARDQFEILLVDNNSRPALESDAQITSLTAEKRIRLLFQEKQGLAFARNLGTRQALGRTLVFVDDDNVLESNYLTELKKLQQNHPDVAVWGPGIIDVNYYEGAPAWVKTRFAYLFQQKNNRQTRFGIEKGWPSYFPAGSGMCVDKGLMEVYIRNFESGRLTHTGRSAGNLSSAEDSQIVWTAIKSGRPAGTSPFLKLTHYIPAKRATLNYLVNLNYGIARSYLGAMREIFPGEAEKFKKRSFRHKFNFLVKTLLKTNLNPFLFRRTLLIEDAWYRGIDDTIDNASPDKNIMTL
jgi:glycosyltransferase involved in cell wall biosynthesis